jgi:hypothetical protein
MRTKRTPTAYLHHAGEDVRTKSDMTSEEVKLGLARDEKNGFIDSQVGTWQSPEEEIEWENHQREMMAADAAKDGGIDNQKAENWINMAKNVHINRIAKAENQNHAPQGMNLSTGVYQYTGPESPEEALLAPPRRTARRTAGDRKTRAKNQNAPANVRNNNSEASSPSLPPPTQPNQANLPPMPTHKAKYMGPEKLALFQVFENPAHEPWLHNQDAILAAYHALGFRRPNFEVMQKAYKRFEKEGDTIESIQGQINAANNADAQAAGDNNVQEANIEGQDGAKDEVDEELLEDEMEDDTTQYNAAQELIDDDEMEENQYDGGVLPDINPPADRLGNQLAAFDTGRPNIHIPNINSHNSEEHDPYRGYHPNLIEGFTTDEWSV